MCAKPIAGSTALFHGLRQFRRSGGRGLKQRRRSRTRRPEMNLSSRSFRPVFAGSGPAECGRLWDDDELAPGSVTLGSLPGARSSSGPTAGPGPIGEQVNVGGVAGFQSM